MADERDRLIYARPVPTRAAPALVAIASWLLAAPLAAAPDIALDWRAPAGCPDVEQVIARLDAIAAAHDKLPHPEQAGRVISIVR